MEQINLFKDPRRFSELPKSAKNGILFLVLAWLGHFYVISRIFQSEFSDQEFYQQLAIAVMSCYFVLRLKNWGRVLSIVGNCAIMIMYLAFLIAFFISGEFNWLVLSGLNIGLFGLSTFYLTRSEASVFFKLHSPKKPETESTDNGNRGEDASGGEGNR